MPTKASGKKPPYTTTKTPNRYFVEPDPESNQVLAMALACLQRTEEAEFQVVSCKDGKKRQMWEVTNKQVQDLGVMRREHDYRYAVWKLEPGSLVAKLYVSYLQEFEEDED